VRITVVDRASLRPVSLGIELASALRTLYPGDWDRSRLPVLIANADTAARIERGDPVESIVSSWNEALRAFLARRAKWLIYTASEENP
jgi:uncharacterized protein YbbC (DUF1343 family)